MACPAAALVRVTSNPIADGVDLHAVAVEHHADEIDRRRPGASAGGISGEDERVRIEVQHRAHEHATSG